MRETFEQEFTSMRGGQLLNLCYFTITFYMSSILSTRQKFEQEFTTISLQIYHMSYDLLAEFLLQTIGILDNLNSQKFTYTRTWNYLAKFEFYIGID